MQCVLQIICEQFKTTTTTATRAVGTDVQQLQAVFQDGTLAVEVENQVVVLLVDKSKTCVSAELGLLFWPETDSVGKPAQKYPQYAKNDDNCWVEIQVQVKKNQLI